MSTAAVGRILLAISLAGLSVGTAAAAEAPDAGEAPVARVTAVVGAATSGDQALSQRGNLGEGQAIETAEDGNCAILLEEDALVEMCGGSSLRLARAQTGQRVLRIDSGEARIVVEPRTAGERIEIHTPAAIATILGTVVYVTVDPVTGETSFTSGDNDVAIRSSDQNVQGQTTIRGGETTTVVPGKPPTERRRLERSALSNLGGCLADLQQIAVAADRAVAEAQVTDKVAALDMNAADLPGVEAGPVARLLAVAGENAEGGGDDLGGGGEILTPIDGAGGDPLGPPPGPALDLPACGGLPGAHCGF